MSSPLLAEGKEAGTPSLSSGPVIVDESPLERLVAQPNPNPLAGFFSLHDDSTPPGGGRPAAFNLASSGDVAADENSANGSSVSTLVAGSLCLLQATFVWGSYLSKSWFDTHVRASVDWQAEYLPFLNGLTDVNVKSTTLPSLFASLEGADQHAATLALILTALFIPCMCMVLCPIWTYNDHEDRKKALGNGEEKSMPRILFEPLVRLSLSGVYILVLVDMGISSIQWTGSDNDGTLTLYNRTQSGLVAFALGMSCAMAVLVVLRVARTRRYDRFQAMLDSASSQSSRRRTRVPPPNAFLLPWRARNSALQARRERQQQQQQQHGQQTEPLLSSDDNNSDDSAGNGDLAPVERVSPSIQPRGNERSVPLLKKICLYEFGILSILLWLPTLFLPVFRISFEGLAAEFMTRVSFQLRLCELPFLLWSRGRASGAHLFVSLAMQLVISVTVYVIPLFVTILAVITCMGSISNAFTKGQTKMCRDYLLWIHPALCGVVFALGLFLAVPAFQPISSYSIEQQSAGLCQQVEDAINEACLKIVGHWTLGSWLLVTQSFALELFVLLTIRWCRL